MSSQIGKIVLISFPPQQWTLITYSSVAYLNTLPAGLCFKPLEYILITIFKENICCLFDTIPLHCFRVQIYFKGTDQAGTFISLKCVVYYANYRSWHQSSKIQVVS